MNLRRRTRVLHCTCTEVSEPAPPVPPAPPAPPVPPRRQPEWVYSCSVSATSVTDPAETGWKWWASVKYEDYSDSYLRSRLVFPTHFAQGKESTREAAVAAANDAVRLHRDRSNAALSWTP